MSRRHLIGAIALVAAALVAFGASPALAAHSGGGGGGGGGGGHGFSGGGGHSFSGGGSFSGAHSFSGPSISRSFSGPSISHSFSGGLSSHSFSPQSLSRGSFGNPGLSNSSHLHDFNSSNWAHGQSNWQGGHGSNWQFERSQSTWQQHLSDWKHGEQWGHGNNWWGNNNWGRNSNWRGNNWWGNNWWGNNWWGNNWWGHNGFRYYPAITLGAFWFPRWNDGYYSNYDYAMPYYGTTSYAAPVVLDQPQTVQAQYADTSSADTQPAADSDTGGEFFAQATAAFRNGQYRDALRLANHAAVESPQNPKAHELISLAMFALADYRGAAIEAHAALAFGPPAAWATVYTYYGDDATYTNQLRALEKYSKENPAAADARFLRAYQYLMLGHQSQALEQLREAVKLAPNDKLAADLLKKYSEAAPERLVPPAPAPLPVNPSGGPRPVDNGAVDS